ncbi:ATP-dependent Clp protease proteolytic subunit-related protein 4, chloroplastic-like [Curcuma longa]|uniref:ATP-dependent Clp protease proteolytic subunit-related protein 4, chloroplastic-like n=1 Tax=Curcuma longa TaxID=136217 RepID=UPI003D9E4BFD
MQCRANECEVAVAAKVKELDQARAKLALREAMVVSVEVQPVEIQARLEDSEGVRVEVEKKRTEEVARQEHLAAMLEASKVELVNYKDGEEGHWANQKKVFLKSEEFHDILVLAGGEKLGYETEAFAIYDVMRYIKTPIFTLCVGNAWGEAALLLAAGAKGNRTALPSSTIMIRQPIARFQGQASDVDIARKEISNVKAELVALYSRHIGKSREQIEEDIRRPKYFSPSEAVEYGIIDKVLYNEKGQEDRSVVSDLKRGQLAETA